MKMKSKFALWLTAAMIALVAGCASRKPVRVESIRTDTVQKVIVRFDSVRIKEQNFRFMVRFDSIAPILDQEGRVSGWDRYHSLEVSNDNSTEIARLNNTIDSLKSARVDTVLVKAPPDVIKVREPSHLSAWQKFQIHSFWFLAVALAASLLYIFRRPLLRLMCRLKL